VRLTRDSGDLHRAALEFYDEEDDVADQSAHGQHLDGEEVGCRQAVPMSGQERLPGRVRAPLRCGLDAILFEDRFDRVARHVVAETLQPAADACVAPGRILGCHAYHKRGDVRLGARATGASRLGSVVLLGDEPPIPTEDRVGCHDSRDVRETAPAEDLAFHG
jgi:hypothetical protein